MKKALYLSIFSVICFASCRKNYVCECKNSNTTYVAGEKEGTKNKAKKYCQGLSTADTKCDIQ